MYYLMVGNGRQLKAGNQQQMEAGVEMGSNTRKAKKEDPGNGNIWGFSSSN